MRALFTYVQENALKKEFCDDQVLLKAAEKMLYCLKIPLDIHRLSCEIQF